MQKDALTLQDIAARKRALACESQYDAAAVALGLMEHVEAIERSIRREAEECWLDMEALLLETEPLVMAYP